MNRNRTNYDDRRLGAYPVVIPSDIYNKRKINNRTNNDRNLQSSCPLNCNNNGVCINGRCYCNYLYYG